MIPGQLIALITFPGVIVHEIGHQLFCRLFGVAIFDVCYFQFDNPAGYVLHETPRKPLHSVLIGIAPFIVSTFVGALIAFPAVIPVLEFDSASPFDVVLAWLGISIAMHAFPSTGDAQSIWQTIQSEDTPLLLKFIAFPIVGIIYLGALGSVFWLDLVYGVLVAGILPKLVINSLS